MRYSKEPKYRKYVKGYRFLSFARRFSDKYGKRLMDTATKTGIDTSNSVVKKTAEATGDLIGNKMLLKSLHWAKQKVKKKKMKDKKSTDHHKKYSKLLMT